MQNLPLFGNFPHEGQLNSIFLSTMHTLESKHTSPRLTSLDEKKNKIAI